MSPEYRICFRCIMDTSDQEIVFDEKGVCNHCHNYDMRAKNEVFNNVKGKEKLEHILRIIKKQGKNKEYDCLIGLSGGVDSSMVAYTVKQHGLRPLAIHLDNGWDAELAVSNIENIVKKLDLDLYTYVLDWEEFRDLHLSFLKASVINSEIPTDHAITAIMYLKAAEHGIQYIISGSNIATEGILPRSWVYENRDWRHIKGIHKRFGSIKLKTFPRVTLTDWLYYTFIKQIRFIRILNYIDYNRQEAIKLLEDTLGWRPYGPKHSESIYTRFYQAYILPKKFNIDKRRAHLSTLICSGQLSRKEALEEIESDYYSYPAMLNEDREYFIKKFGLSHKEFDDIMSVPATSHRDYPNNDFWFNKFGFFVQWAKKKATFV